MKSKVLLALAIVSLAAPTHAVSISWVDWTSATLGAAGSASGLLSPWNGPISVGYSGDVTFAQLGSGINYWTEGSPAPYTGNTYVDNAPIATEMVALSLSGTNTVTFSTPISGLVMAIVSQGQPSVPVTYDFDAAFSVLSEGKGYWGDGSYTLGAGDQLIGSEFHGVIQYAGPVSSLSWTVNPNEYWHGITFGTAAIPEPGSIVLLGVAGVGYLVTRRRRKRA